MRFWRRLCSVCNVAAEVQTTDVGTRQTRGWGEANEFSVTVTPSSLRGPVVVWVSFHQEIN